MTKHAKKSAHLHAVDLPKTTLAKIPGSRKSSVIRLCWSIGIGLSAMRAISSPRP